MRLMPGRARIEEVLRVRGISSPALRGFICNQLVLTDASLALGLMLAWYSLWPLAFAIGATIAMYSFWSLTTLSIAIIQDGGRGKYSVGKFLLFNVRLALIAVILYVFIIKLRVPVPPLAVGLGSVMFSITLWGLSRITLAFGRTRET